MVSAQHQCTQTPSPPSLSVACPCVSQGSDLRLKDSNGQTLLHVAARNGRDGVVTMLLHRGMDVNARDRDGLSPLLLAVQGRYLGLCTVMDVLLGEPALCEQTRWPDWGDQEGPVEEVTSKLIQAG